MIFNMIQQLREGVGFFRIELNRNKGGIMHGQFIRIADSPFACPNLFISLLEVALHQLIENPIDAGQTRGRPTHWAQPIGLTGHPVIYEFY